MPRIARIVAPGYPHHVVQRGNNRQAVFFEDSNRRFYLKLLQKYSSENKCILNAFCLMNNHIHLLLVPCKESSLAKMMQKLSLVYCQYINKKYKRTGRLWECRFHSCVIDKDSYLLSVCRYIERNPIRANLCDRAEQYKWSSAKVNIGGGEKTNFVEPIWKNYVDREEYVKFVRERDVEEELKDIRKYTSTGKPLGAEKFIQEICQGLSIVIKNRRRGRPAIKANDI